MHTDRSSQIAHRRSKQPGAVVHRNFSAPAVLTCEVEGKPILARDVQCGLTSVLLQANVARRIVCSLYQSHLWRQRAVAPASLAALVETTTRGKNEAIQIPRSCPYRMPGFAGSCRRANVAITKASAHR